MIRFTQPTNILVKSKYFTKSLTQICTSSCIYFRRYKSQHYNFCTQISITNIREVQQGRRFLQQKNINQAEQMYERAISILPFFIQSEPTYNQEFSDLLYEIITVHAWKGNLRNIQTIFNKYQQEVSNRNKSIQNEKLNSLKLLLGYLGKCEYSFDDNQKLIAQRVKLSKQYSLEQKYQVEKELCSQIKDKQPNNQNIQPWIHSELKQTWLFIISSLLSRTNMYSNPNYNKVCNTLLKNTERSFPKNVIKPLIFINTNLLRNTQYLQAEGILSYASDRKRQNIRAELLKSNQQYILLQLLLGKTMMGVERKSEGQKLFDEYRPRFNLQIFLLQGYLLDSI